MIGRSRGETWFRFGRADFDLDSLDSYAVTPTTRAAPRRPAKKIAAAAGTARKALASARD